MPTSTNTLGGLAAAAAIGVLVAWLVFLGFMTQHANATDVEWARLGTILGSLEAVAFGAAGALFGVTIQRQRVQDAKEHAAKADAQAADARQNAADHAKDAANGKALAIAIKSRAKQVATRGVPTGQAQPAAPDDDLVAMARELFPD